MPLKDPDHFIVHGRAPAVSFESPLAKQTEYLTPQDQFFVCNSGSTPIIDANRYTLSIVGDSVERPMTFSYDDLLKLPHRTVDALIECAGNHRLFFRSENDQSPVSPSGTSDLNWSTGAVGMGQWRGVPLCNVLTLAGLKSHALQICSRGGEKDSCEGEVRMPMSLEKALDPDTLLAIDMNGAKLPPDHGYPVRLIVPGWIGAYSVKWLTEIEVRSEPAWVRRNTVSYTMQGDAWPASSYEPARGAPITEFNIKSSLALPLPASKKAGWQHLHGFARSSGRTISSVHWSDDSGSTWHQAELTGPNEPYGWTRFEFDWLARTGKHQLMTRATDEAGQTQPQSVSFNTAGYLFNAIHPHPVSVS